MIELSYLLLFLGLSAGLTYWRVVNYKRHFDRRG